LQAADRSICCGQQIKKSAIQRQFFCNPSNQPLLKSVMQSATSRRKCPRCGATLAAGVPDGLCLRCLLELGIKTGSEAEVAAADTDAPPQEIFDRYRIIAKIGEGGCGIVYQAEQLTPVRREVAIKVIKLGMDTQTVIARFEAERQALALMDHPHIAKVFDAGTTRNGRPFFVMELASGKPVTEFCDQQKLSLRQRLELFIQVCQAVQHAHQKGVIHRDLKPSNILVLEQDGKPMSKVIDFGVAKATARQRLADQTVYTAFDQFVGTPSYMSPEQTALTGEDIDTRSDIYSLGVLLYELLTGHPPFSSERLRRAALDEVLRIIREEEPPLPSTQLTTLTGAELSETAQRRQLPPARFAGELRGDLDWLVMKALEKDRSRRYDTAAALAEDIQRHLANEPILARPPSAIYRLQKMARRNKVVFGAAAAVACALIAGLTISTTMFFKEKQERERLEQRAYFSDMNLVARMATMRIGGLEGAVHLLDAWRQHKPDFRGWEWYYLNGLCHRELLTIHADSNGLWSVAWSPDGKRLATGGDDGVVKLWESGTGHALTNFQGHTKAVLSVAWSPDGLRLASGGADTTIRIWDLKTGGSVVLRRDHSDVSCLAWNPDSIRIVSGSWDGTVRVWDTRKGTNTQVFTTGRQVLSVGWNNDGTRLVASGRGGLLKTWDATSGQEVWSLPPNMDADGTVAAWSPDGQQVATGCTDNSVNFRDAATGTNLISFWDNHNPILSVAWSPDGTRLASATSGDGRIAIRDVQNGGRVFQDFRGHLGSVRCVCWRPDGGRIASASADGTVKVWDVNGGNPSVINLLQPDQATSLSWSPDGTKLAVGCRRMGPWIWDFDQGGAPIAMPAGYMNWTWAVAWNADGTRLAAGGSSGIDLWDPSRLAKVWHAGKDLGEGDYRGAIAWSPDFKRIAVIGYWHTTLDIWDSVNGELLKAIRLPQPGTGSLAWSPDGHSVAVGVRSQIYVWDTATYVQKRILTGHSDIVRCLAWSPDGKRLASGSDDTSAKIWDVNQGREIVTLFGHAAPIYSLAWSPDGTRLATASWDMSVKVWDPFGGAEICSFEKPGNIVQMLWSVAWSPDGRRLACSDIEGDICILDSNPGWQGEAAGKIESAPSPARNTEAETIRSLKLYCDAVEPNATNNADALRRLAWIRATSRYPELRDGRKAVAFAEQAVTLNGDQNAGLISILAAAYAECGDFPKAISLQKQAMLLPPTVDLKAEYAAELRSYESHQPWRDDSW
jgi:WD40 repeat protein/serine/threonine protein kinase